MSNPVDVVIAGGGPVGAFAALCLRDSPLSVLHVDSPEADAGERPIALAHGSRQLLEARDVFRRIPNTPIRTIHVSQRGAFGRVLLEAGEHGVPALGYVADYSAIRSAIAESPAALPGHVTGWTLADGHVTVHASDQHGVMQDIHARLLVLADGTGRIARLGSPEAADTSVIRDYGQSAIVAQVRTEVPHCNTAYERFTAEGPLALLPNGDGFALVWCVAKSTAPALLDMDNPSFLSRLGAMFGLRLGKFVDAGQRSSFPLSLRYLKRDFGSRIVAIGNAAQSLHPVAGQGLNLGLRDAWELAAALRECGDGNIPEGFGEGFMRQRGADRRLEIGLTDSLVRIFSRPGLAPGVLRGMALLAVDTLPPARRLLAQTMMYGLRSNHRS